MISKEKFIQFMGYIKETQEKEDKIDAFVRELSFDGYCYILTKEIERMIEMICGCMEIEDDETNLWGNDITYFVYELDWGKNWKPDSILTADGESIDISTVEKLYDYLIGDKLNKNDQ